MVGGPRSKILKIDTEADESTAWAFHEVGGGTREILNEYGMGALEEGRFGTQHGGMELLQRHI